MYNKDNVAEWVCPNCRSKDGLPLFCKECNIHTCSECWLAHDVEMMRKSGLLKCPCGEDHVYEGTNNETNSDCNVCDTGSINDVS